MISKILVKVNTYYILFIIFFVLIMNVKAERFETDFNQNWKFILENNSDFSDENFNDSKWRTLNVPHDWAFEKGIRIGGNQGQGGGYHDGGIGWYRKPFLINKQTLKKTVYIEFQGVYMNSEVWVNGTLLGKRPMGYISFRYEISKLIKAGKNVIAVRVDNSLEPSARWYHPCGIFAPVTLIVVNPIHISPNGIYIKTPKINREMATVNAEVKIQSPTKKYKNVKLRTTVLSSNAKILITNLVPIKDVNGTTTVKMEVNHPQLWSPEKPTLYTLLTEVIVGNNVVDKVSTNFGFKSVEWKTETGFWLNGENIKLKGVCEHWEGGPVGGAYTKPLLRWKLKLLKEMGINAIRPSHNAFPPMFYDICDEIGLLVMNELFDGWSKKATYDYGAQAFAAWWKKDVTEWITRDRNHVSVFVWSIGNETHGNIASEIVKFCNQLDPTRLVTSGSGNPDDMQVVGINGSSETKSFIEGKRFQKPFVSTEAPHTWQTRGYYRTQTWWRDSELPGTYPLPNLTDKEIFFFEWADPKVWNNKKNRFNSSYDNATVRISARKKWEVMRDNPWHSGHFRWTGFDYYGEAGLAHGGLPFNLFMGGAIDVAGFEKDLFYFYQSQWTSEPMLHILPSWTHPRMEKGTVIPVWVYSNTDEVELFLNGKSLGKDKPGTLWNEMQCEWMVPYKEGKLEAVAYKNNKEVKRTSFETASQPVKLNNSIQILKAEGGFEANYLLTSEGIDSKNNIYPYAQNKVYYALSGNIKKVSLESGSPIDFTSRAQANYRALFMGKTRAFLQAIEKSKSGNVVVGSILGDQSLYLSKSISIFAEQINIIGNDSKLPIQILYTTNGNDPTQNGIPYTQPFDITDGTTVKAIVKQNGKVLFAMEEAFGEGQGLFWGNEKSDKMWSGRGMTLQAETATLKGNAKISEDAHWNRGEIVTFNNQEGSILWYQENDGDEAEYMLRFRYSHNDSSNTFPISLIVNDKVITTIEFKPTGSSNANWVFVGVKAKFKQGANTIELKTTGRSGPNIDELFIE